MRNEEYKNKVKTAIELYELRANGLDKLSGTGVNVKNIIIKKNEVIADITLITDAEAGHSEQYRAVSYPRIKVDELIAGFKLQ
jgi:hypothetical protein